MIMFAFKDKNTALIIGTMVFIYLDLLEKIRETK